MNPHLRNAVSLFILVAYALAGVLLEVGHRDVHNMVFDATAVLSSHECGTTEIHIPLDKRHDCLACTQSTLRIATAVAPIPANIALFLCLNLVPVSNRNIPLTDVIHSGKRGPPVSSLPFIQL